MTYNVDPYLAVHRQRIVEAERRRAGNEAARFSNSGNRRFARFRRDRSLEGPAAIRDSVLTYTNA
ncbi:hypothetical protein AYO38_03255 [bacterium SCGC AG-212-C10]|nr:hypothetical protein AYO38_03255 [bacterium SCGC AG-212-C10]